MHSNSMLNKSTLRASIVGGCFLFLDQWIKFFIRISPGFTAYLWRPWLGIEFFANRGVAFNIPIPNQILLFATPLILIGLALMLLRTKKQITPKAVMAMSLIVSGALSNFLDRYLFGITIDYIRIATAVINIADIMIVLGLLTILYQQKRKTPSSVIS